MKTKNILKTIFGIFLLALLVAPFVSAGSTWFYFESDTSASSMTLTQGQTTNLLLTATSHNNVPVSLEKLEAIQGSNIYLIEHWDESGTKQSETSYLFNKVYTLDSGTLNPGTYTLRFSATTNTGVEYSELTLIVNSQSSTPKDTTPPVVTISTPTDGATYTSHRTTFSFSISDDSDVVSCWYSLGHQGVPFSCSKAFSATIGTVSSEEGTNTWTVYAQDKYGNLGSDSVTFTVDTSSAVIDNVDPTITILGDNPLTMQVGTEYVEYGATALDNVDGNLTSEIVITNNVNPSVVGDYTVEYSVEDSSGNTATETRTVYVVEDAIPFTITVIRPEDGEDYDDGGIVFEVELNREGSVEYSLDGADRDSMTETSSGSLVFVSDELDLDEDDYTVTFYAEDEFGNTDQITVNFEIEDDDNNKKSSSSYDGSSYEFKLYEEQSNPKKAVIDLSDETTAKKLNWIQRFINWLVQLFGGDAVY